MCGQRVQLERGDSHEDTRGDCGQWGVGSQHCMSVSARGLSCTAVAEAPLTPWGRPFAHVKLQAELPSLCPQVGLLLIKALFPLIRTDSSN